MTRETFECNSSLEKLKAFAAIGGVLLVLIAFALVGCTPSREKVVIFNAAGLNSVLDVVKSRARDDLNANVLFESSGSQVACRKLSELGRACDVLIVADSNLIPKLTGDHCSWRIDFAGDSVVLAVGTRARYVDEAEVNWVDVLTRDDVRIARVDENLGPIGYRTLLVWKLQEKKTSTGLYDKLKSKTEKIVDDVAQLMPLLKTGDIDYAFAYRSTCVAHDVRFIELAGEVNLGDDSIDYSGAEVTYTQMKGGAQTNITVKGEPILFSLSIPDTTSDGARSTRFVNYLLGECADVIEEKGFKTVRPAFYGPREDYAPFEKVARYGGQLR